MSSNELDGAAEGGAVERAKADSEAKKSGFGRLVLFIQQVFAELKKVVTPTRKELINYFFVVLGFVVVMMGIVWVLDQAFGWLTVFTFSAA